QRFLDEWLVYHKMIGIDHFFLYDHEREQKLKDFLTPHADYLTVINYWETGVEAEQQQDAQDYAYTHALNNYIKPYNWVVFLDADEFLVFKAHSSVKEFLLDFKNEVSISLNWHMFGHNGFFNDPTRLITSSLNRRMLWPFSDVKTITKTDAIAAINNPHYCELKYGIRVDANKRPYVDEVYEGKTQVAHVNHYHCRSFKTWMKRAERGHANYSLKPYFTVESCLRLFAELTRDKNEHVDDFMLQYAYTINKQINHLNKNKHPVLKEFITSENLTNIQSGLSHISEYFFSESVNYKSIGLNGKAGIILFLFHYSSLVQQHQYNELALELLDNVTEQITENSPTNISDGLAGYGIAIEHLVAQGFIEIDTNELLEDIDLLLTYHLNKIFSSAGVYNKDDTDLSTYYFSRLNNPFNPPYKHTEPKNKKALDLIQHIKLKSDHTDLGFLDFLSKYYLHADDRTKIEEYIQQAISPINNFINSEQQSFEKFDLIRSIELLLNLFKKTEDVNYLNTSNKLITIENAYWQYISNAKICDNYRLTTGLRYLKLSKMLKQPAYAEKGLQCLFKAINNSDKKDTHQNNYCLKKIIVPGLIYLNMMGNWSDRLYDITLWFASEYK
ncbi:MAG TPA: glycosyltransferase family 92 protein, partial [Mucilaginibacter sp.]|nr:glycosyltransferase family 92 protein [Mucilaginibacter sp.]